MKVKLLLLVTFIPALVSAQVPVIDQRKAVESPAANDEIGTYYANGIMVGDMPGSPQAKYTQRLEKGAVPTVKVMNAAPALTTSKTTAQEIVKPSVVPIKLPDPPAEKDVYVPTRRELESMLH
jgi:hypothetical protein